MSAKKQIKEKKTITSIIVVPQEILIKDMTAFIRSFELSQISMRPSFVNKTSENIRD